MPQAWPLQEQLQEWQKLQKMIVESAALLLRPTRRVVAGAMHQMHQARPGCCRSSTLHGEECEPSQPKDWVVM